MCISGQNRILWEGRATCWTAVSPFLIASRVFFPVRLVSHASPFLSLLISAPFVIIIAAAGDCKIPCAAAGKRDDFLLNLRHREISPTLREAEPPWSDWVRMRIEGRIDVLCSMVRLFPTLLLRPCASYESQWMVWEPSHISITKELPSKFKASDLMQRQSYQVKTVLEQKGARKKTSLAFKDSLGNPFNRSPLHT